MYMVTYNDLYIDWVTCSYIAMYLCGDVVGYLYPYSVLYIAILELYCCVLLLGEIFNDNVVAILYMP